MTRGIIYTGKTRELNTAEGTDLEEEIRSVFGSGTQMQEIYIPPQCSPQTSGNARQNSLPGAERQRHAGRPALGGRQPHGAPGTAERRGSPPQPSWPCASLLRNAASGTLSTKPLLNCLRIAPRSYAVTSPNGKRLPFHGFRPGEAVRMKLEPFAEAVMEGLPQA